MRWPDIFYRAGKRRDEKAPTFKRPGDAGPRLNSPAMPTVAIKPTPTVASPVSGTDTTRNVATETGKNASSGEEIAAQKPAAEVGKSEIPKASEAETSSTGAKAESAPQTKSPPLEPRLAQTGPILIPSRDPATGSTVAQPVAVAATSIIVEPDPPQSSSPGPTVSSKEAESASKVTAPSVAEVAPKTPVPTIRAKRKMKLTDLARMIFSTPHEPGPVVPESTSTVSPPAFTVSVPVGTVTQAEPPAKLSDAPTLDLPREEKSVAQETPKPVEPIPAVEPAAKEPVAAEASAEPSTPTPEPEKKSEVSASEKPTATTSTPGSATIPHAKDLETGPKPESTPTSAPPESTVSKSSEKKEFLLVNGERILGHVLSETPENIYLDHGTLGVLTLPRSQIATRPIEIILINGDRIVGDIMAETPDTLYVRHASLGMLTVPRAQRSTRVVEALLKDGDRILGEVLAETENFTVIRSATLGTVAVPHNKVAMLNRKIEQIELKSLPATAPTIEDKK